LFQRLQDGRLLRYQFGSDISVTTTTPSLTQTKYVWGRGGRWTVYFFGSGQEVDYKTAQQLELGPGQITSLDRNGKSIELDDPRVQAVPLPAAGCQFLAVPVIRQDVPIVLPAGNPLEQLIYRIVMDQFQFPNERIPAQALRKSKIAWDGFTGERFWMITSLERVGKARVAVIAVQIQGQFTGNLPGEPALRDAKITLRWDLNDQALLDLSGQVRYDRRFDQIDEEVVARLALSRQSLDRLPIANRESAVEALLHLADSITMYQEKKYVQIVRRVTEFNQQFPGSLWQPMVGFLGNQAEARSMLASPEAAQQLRKALGNSIVEWQAATTRGDAAKLTALAEGLRELNRAGRDQLLKLAEDQDAKVRALALFAVGFGTHPEDLAVVQTGARDAEPVPRAWATYALVIRGSPKTDRALLTRLIKDESELVRARAALAIGACVEIGSSDQNRFRAMLTSALSDASENVRRAAAEALAYIGTRADLAPLRKAADAEKDSPARQMMRRTIERLERQ
jgi:hypothetical protein